MNSPAGERDDAALAAAALGGEDAAFTALMRRHKALLYRFVRRYVGDPDEALDLVQESFLSAWSALESFDARRPMPAWLRRIALNKCRDWSRRRRVRAFFFHAAALDDAAPPSSPAPEAEDEAARLHGRLAALDAAIAALPQALKEPLLLTAFEGLSHHQAARLLHLSPMAIETRVYRAKQALRRAIAG